jgi:hypothetical protein
MKIRLSYNQKGYYSIIGLSELALVNLYKALRSRRRLVTDDKNCVEVANYIESHLNDLHGIEKAKELLK